MFPPFGMPAISCCNSSLEPPGRMNTAADFLSRLDISPKEKVLLQIREDIQRTPIPVNIQSSDIHEEDQFYFLPGDDSETDEDIWERKQRARKRTYNPQEQQTDPQTDTNEPNSQPTIGLQQHPTPRTPRTRPKAPTSS